MIDLKGPNIALGANVAAALANRDVPRRMSYVINGTDPEINHRAGHDAIL